MAHPYTPKPLGVEHLKRDEDTTLAGAAPLLSSMVHTYNQSFVHFDRP